MHEPSAARSLSTVSMSRKLKLSQMMVFSRVLDTSSFIRAANELGLTQPAVSKAIFEMESMFGEPLFHRSNRGVTPTEFGAMLGRRVRSLMSELRHLTDDVQAFRQGDRGQLVVGTLIAASAVLLPRSVASLHREAPGIIVTLREGTAAQLFPKMMMGEIDIVVGRLPERDSPIFTAYPIRHETLYDEEFCVVCGPRHPLVGRTSVAVTELGEADWILPLPDSPARTAVERMFGEAGMLLPVPRVESLSLLANVGLLRRTQLLSFMPLAAAMQLVQTDSLVILPMPALHYTSRVGFSVRADKDLTPSCKRFITHLKQAGEDPLNLQE
ncbi:LysR family transcriptional regulator [Pseudorhodoferax sp. Leaf265]|uniref:LysR family transcriptional regulator n=1 Tax=Pseudorhodoferax sp. Leaf265 TaxID=1736315 RepID=UPI0006F3C9D9|nr:LysR family transcriptional regulator [Pseudorhodoferax sp. Leaf265]KQP03822.1 LysR family transcriptional regulator [Pseudorhodoferax sp. Leaf265]